MSVLGPVLSGQQTQSLIAARDWNRRLDCGYAADNLLCVAL
jgi:hypothetical protein